MLLAPIIVTANVTLYFGRISSGIVHKLKPSAGIIDPDKSIVALIVTILDDLFFL